MPRKNENAGYRAEKLKETTCFCWAADANIKTLTQIQQNINKVSDEFTRKNFETCINSEYENMKLRCYNLERLKTHRNSWGVIVCDEWLNDRKEFYRFFKDNYYSIKGEKAEKAELDKDFAKMELYSADTCVYIPHEINSCISQMRVNVSFDEQKGYCYGKNYGFDSEDSAVQYFIDDKMKKLESLVNKYKSDMPAEVLHKVQNYNITPFEVLYNQKLYEYREELSLLFYDGMPDAEAWAVILAGITLPEKL